MLRFSNQKRTMQLFASFSINRPEHCSQSSLLPQECLSNPSLIPLCVHLSAERKRRQLQRLGSHLILSNIYESKEILEHMLQSMTKQKKIIPDIPSLLHPPKELFICNDLAFCKALQGVSLPYEFVPDKSLLNEATSGTRDFFPPAMGITL